MNIPEDILSLISEMVLAINHRPVAIGVDGYGGSGKSAFARELAGILPVATLIVQGDDFYSDISKLEKSLMNAEEGYERYFDWRRLKSEVMTSVCEGAPSLRYQRYNWDIEAMGDWIEVPMPEVVIVEGAYTLRPELRDAFDVTVLIQTSRPTRVERQKSRAQNSSLWIDRWMASEDFYAAKNPWKDVDFTVKGE